MQCCFENVQNYRQIETIKELRFTSGRQIETDRRYDRELPKEGSPMSDNGQKNFYWWLRGRVAGLQVEVECGPVSLYSGGAGPCSVSVKDVEVQDLFGRSCKSALPMCLCSALMDYTVIIYILKCHHLFYYYIYKIIFFYEKRVLQFLRRSAYNLA